MGEDSDRKRDEGSPSKRRRKGNNDSTAPSPTQSSGTVLAEEPQSPRRNPRRNCTTRQPSRSPSRRKVEIKTRLLPETEEAELKTCIHNLQLLGLHSAVRSLLEQAFLFTGTRYPEALSFHETMDSLKGGRKVGEEGQVQPILEQVYSCLRRYEAIGTIDHLDRTLGAVGSLTPTMQAAAETWRKLQLLDPRVFAPEDLNVSDLPNPILERNVKWAAAALPGWQENTDGAKTPLHEYIEDVFYIPRSNEACFHNGKPVHIFCVADGHGGRGAADFFVKRLPGRLLTMLNSRDDWCLSGDNGDMLKKLVSDAFIEIDDEFCEMRKHQYLEFIRSGGNKPADDGCTLNIILVYGVQWILTAHVGDSRTVIARSNPIRRTGGGKPASQPPPAYTRWQVTADHSPAHPVKALAIQSAGGIFRESKAQPPITQIVPSNARAPIRFLQKARVFRPENFSNPYGLQLKNLGMGDAMGDVIMKIEPRLFQGTPDVDILQLEDKRNYLLIIATDGLWGTLDDADDAEKAAERVADAYSRFDNVLADDYMGQEVDEKAMGSLRVSGCVNADRLKRFSSALCQRQGGPLKALFRPQQRGMWDDVSVVTVEIDAVE